MHFGKKLLQSRYEPWAAHYLDYAQLKTLLKEETAHTDAWWHRRLPSNHNNNHEDEYGAITQQQQQQPSRSPSNSSLLSAVSRMSHWSFQDGLPSFIMCLSEEVERILFFFLQEQAEVAAELEACRQDQLLLQRQDTSVWLTTTTTTTSTLTTENEEEEGMLVQKFYQVALHLLRLIQYVELNMTGIRKILKKHDKRFHTKLSTTYLGKRATLLQPLLSTESLDALTKLLESALKEWAEFIKERRKLLLQHHQSQQHKEEGGEGGGIPELGAVDEENSNENAKPIERNVSSASGLSSTSAMLQYQNADTVRRENISDLSDLENVHHRHTNNSKTGENGVLVFRCSPSSELEHNDSGNAYSNVFPVGQNPRIVLLQIKAARSRLQETSDFVKMLAAPVLIMASTESGLLSAEEESQEFEDEEKKAEEERSRSVSNVLNLMSTFLYVCNYYIDTVASNTYAEKLGGDASQAGIIIGMTPIAALASTLLYSWWTSYSYKSALIFAAACSCVGNLCYGAGLPLNSFKLVLIGRLWNGFGSARSINRRYIADSYSRRHRTAASAAFVTAGAMGMSVGPATAALLEFTVPNLDETDPDYNVYWQVENAPGWIMFVVWFLFMLALIFFFRDPPRRQKKTSQQQTPQSTPQPEGSLAKKRPSMELRLAGEKRPLLLNHEDTPSELTVSLRPNVYDFIPVFVTFTIYFVLKLILECLLSSSPMISSFYFGWTGKLQGLYLAILGLLMLPANWLVGYLSTSYDDRELVGAIQLCMLVGCVAVLNLYGSGGNSSYSLIQYLVSSVLIFVSTNALEGPNMSLLSKTIPRTWSEGFFNVGLLATEAGTLGRAVGDMMLTAVGVNGMEFVLNRIFGAMAVLSFGCIILTYRFYAYLIPIEHDD